MRIEEIRFLTTAGIPAFVALLVGYASGLITFMDVITWSIAGLAGFFWSSWLRRRYSSGFDLYGRVFFHSSAGVIIVTIGLYYTLGKAVLVTSILLLIFATQLTLERLDISTTFSLARNDHPRRPSHYLAGSLWLTSCLTVLLILPSHMAYASILVLALGDPAASFVGRSLGRTRNPLNDKKTLEGSAACFAMSFFAVLLFFGPLMGLLAGLIAAAAEALPWRVADNLIIPPAVGATLLVATTIRF